MRLSGNYFDRLLWCILPLTLFALGILCIDSKERKTVLVCSCIFTFTFWLIDTLIIYFKFKKPKRLTFDTALRCNGEILLPTDIDQITPVANNRNRMMIYMVEFKLVDNTRFFVIDKPRFFLAEIFGQKSRTIKKLLQCLPELAPKVKEERII